jgi:type III pantothenate kinase
MVICIDVGNSSAKFCLFDGPAKHGEVHRIQLAGSGRVWDSAVKSIAGDARRIRGSVISSVVPKLTPSIARVLERTTGRRPVIVDAHLRFPFRIAVPHPETTGADRLCCAAGAIDKRRSSAILIDVGSAVTVDLVVDAVFKGGIILAGPDLSLLALARHTEKLPLVEYRYPRRGRPPRFDSTENSLLLGARMNTLGGIREAVRFLDRFTGRPLGKIVTGGGAAALSPSLPKSWRRDPYLVLKGLYRLWRMNTSA